MMDLGVTTMDLNVRWRVKQLRLERAAKLGRDVTLEEVSHNTGIALSTLSNIENNRVVRVDFTTLTRLAKFYEVTSICDVLELTTEKRAPGLVGRALSSAY